MEVKNPNYQSILAVQVIEYRVSGIVHFPSQHYALQALLRITFKPISGQCTQWVWTLNGLAKPLNAFLA